MSVEKLVTQLIDLGVRLEVEDGQLRVIGLRHELAPAFLPRLKEQKEELLQYLEVIGRKSAAKPIRIERVPTAESYPLAAAQFRLWVVSQFEGGSSAYNVPMTTEFRAYCDPTALERAIRAVIERYEILRTIFKEDGQGEIRQWILPPKEIAFKLDFQDYRSHPERAERVKEFVEMDASRPFDLVNGPLLRAALFRLEDARYLFCLNLHHIISDGWSLEVLSKEILLFYQAFTDNRNLNLPELPFQYKDYVAWQTTWFTDDRLKKSRAFWLDKLSGKLPLLKLPGEKSRPKVKTYRGRSMKTWIAPEIARAFSRFCSDQGGTLFMGLLAAWNTLLYHYTKERNFIIGTPVAGRSHPDLERQIGLFINLLALRNEVDPEEEFPAFFQRVKASVIAGFEHQDFPFDQLVDDLTLKKDLSRNAVFDCLITLQNVADNSPDKALVGEADADTDVVLDGGLAPSKYDLELIFEEVGPHLYLATIFNEDVYEYERIEQLINHFKNILTRIVKDPAVAIRDIDFLSATEERQLLTFSTGPTASPESDESLIDLFNRQVTGNPEAIALKVGAKEFTYRELDSLSNHFCDYLVRQCDVQPGELVGIQLNRSEWMVITILAILKGGGGYVPIDPTFPTERIQYIRNDSQCKLIVDAALLAQYASMEHGAATPQERAIPPATVAYVMYTSGSTGQPKGVAVEHRNVVSFIDSFDQQFGLKNYRMVAATANYTFDISVLEILGALCSGRCVVLFSEEELYDPEIIMNKLDREAVQIFQLTPSRLLQLGDGFYKRHFEHLRVVITGGETLREDQYRSLKSLRSIKSYNGYGPTETTVYSTCLDIAASTHLSIGQPLMDEQVYVLNDAIRLVPIGVPGEVYIGGKGVSRGYLNHPEWTAEKFLADPFRPGERLYKSGDVAHWGADGQLHFVGRSDNQIKLRGYRIELDEIEKAVLRHPAIRQAAVIMKKDESGDANLSGYFVAGEPVAPADLKTFLKTILPAYMIPGRFLQIEAFSMTSNGKVDKKDLPDPDSTYIESSDRYVAPSNELERKLTQIWSEILKIENIGLQDDFFELGGQSIKLIRLLNRYGTEFKVKLSVDALYQNPLLIQHAQLLETAHSQTDNSGLVPFGRFEARKSTMILIPPVTGNPLVYKAFAQALEDEYNCFGLNYPGLDFTTPPLLSIAELAAAFEVILKEHGISHQETITILGYSMGGTIAFELVKLLEAQHFPCTLILVDRPPNDGEIIELNDWWREEEQQYFDEMVFTAYGDLEEREISKMKNFLHHNLTILSSHRSTGKVKANILAIQGSSLQEMDMRKWQAFTDGQFEITYIDKEHYTIFNHENTAALTNIIKIADHNLPVMTEE